MGLLERATQKSKLADSEQAQSRLRDRLSEQGLSTPLYVLGANVDSLSWMHLLNVQAVSMTIRRCLHMLRASP
jgi:hypothetical protein